MQHKVEICGVNTAKLKVLKNEETQALLLRAKAGDKQACEELIAGNLRLVLSVIQRFFSRGEKLDDLFQVGCIGLIKAIDNFNTGLDVRFSTYGDPIILSEVRRYLRDNSAIWVPRAMRDTAYKVLQTKDAFMAQHQREPTVDEIAAILGIRREDIVFALDAIVDPVSLYEPMYSDNGEALCVMDQVKDRKSIDKMWVERIVLAQWPGAEDTGPAVFPGQGPDGGLRRDRYFPGPGVAAGEEYAAADQKRDVKKNRWGCSKMKIWRSLFL